ncbi:hypothetical protein DVP43_15185 [Yersinia enterocolitica]|nr:hypothetical protein [Yersinia enterocolitica]EKN5105820.1 hypothetical protein [Yersinia enterocolitica]EKN5134109.1 hypothetical protein [Yersinia enterocolitica]EKN5938946.1 hypothetical protein [Yersinia enterocolitica]EKN5948163.1 hypothetical protein [Yersinia enterocolitica]
MRLTLRASLKAVQIGSHRFVTHLLPTCNPNYFGYKQCNPYVNHACFHANCHSESGTWECTILLDRMLLWMSLIRVKNSI